MQEINNPTDELVESNLKLVRHVIKKYYPSHIADDDAFQLGCMGLMNAVKSYDASRGSFSTYAAFFIRGSINAHTRYKYAAKRKGDLGIASLDSIVAEKGTQSIALQEVCGGESFEEDVINNEMLRELLATTELKEVERQCLDMYYFQGFNQVEMSKMLNIINVSRTINNALKKLRKNAFEYAC